MKKWFGYQPTLWQKILSFIGRSMEVVRNIYLLSFW